MLEGGEVSYMLPGRMARAAPGYVAASMAYRAGRPADASPPVPAVNVWGDSLHHSFVHAGVRCVGPQSSRKGLV